MASPFVVTVSLIISLTSQLKGSDGNSRGKGLSEKNIRRMQTTNANALRDHEVRQAKASGNDLRSTRGAFPTSREPSGWKVGFQPKLGQELIYDGFVTERCSSQQGVTLENRRRLQARCLVTDISSNEVELATVTFMYPENQSDKSPEQYFALITQTTKDSFYRWKLNGGKIAQPVDEQPRWELGYLLPTPKVDEPITVGSTWVQQAGNDEYVPWTATGFDEIAGLRLARIDATISSNNWGKKSTDHGSWNMETTVWIKPTTGEIMKYRRTLKTLSSGGQGVSKITTTEYDLATAIDVKDRDLTVQTEQLKTAARMQHEFELALASPTPKAKLVPLEQTLAQKLESSAPSPYRNALKQLHQQIKAAATNPSKSRDVPKVVARQQQLSLGSKSRSFVTRNFDDNSQINQKTVLGKTSILVLLSPGSKLGERALVRAIASASEGKKPGHEIVVYAICQKAVDEDLKVLRERVPGNYVMAMGGTFDKAFGISAFPHTIVLDSAGMLRGNIVGVGPAYDSELMESLESAAQTELELASQKKKAIR